MQERPGSTIELSRASSQWCSWPQIFAQENRHTTLSMREIHIHRAFWPYTSVIEPLRPMLESALSKLPRKRNVRQKRVLFCEVLLTRRKWEMKKLLFFLGSAIISLFCYQVTHTWRISKLLVFTYYLLLVEMTSLYRNAEAMKEIYICIYFRKTYSSAHLRTHNCTI